MDPTQQNPFSNYVSLWEKKCPCGVEALPIMGLILVQGLLKPIFQLWLSLSITKGYWHRKKDT